MANTSTPSPRRLETDSDFPSSEVPAMVKPKKRQKVQNMALNIKNEEAHRLARKLARATGKSITVAVREAIRERLERIQLNSKRGLVKRNLKISADFAPLFKE